MPDEAAQAAAAAAAEAGGAAAQVPAALVAGGEGEGRGGGRGPNFLEHMLAWTDVPCRVCNLVAGQIKYLPSPGGMMPPAWSMRLWLPDQNAWGKRSPDFRTIRCSTIGADDVKVRAWAQEKKKVCACVAP